MDLMNSGRLWLAGRPRPMNLQGGGPGGGDLSYLLRDLFTTDRAAGAVNATPAEPGPGTRVVVDGNSVLSITGGVLNFATGGVTNGNPGYWLDSVVRVFGRAVLGTVVFTSGDMRFGWDANQSGAMNDQIRMTGTLFVVVNGGAVISLGGLAGGAYQLCLILRAAGCYWFIKGGTFTNWTLLYVDSSSTGNVFPGTVAGGATSVFTVDNIRVPVPLYIVPALAYDTFTRADAALGSSETVGPDGASQVVTARLWTGATWTIVSNAAVNTPNLGADVIVNGTFAADTDWNKGAGWTISAGVAAAVTASSALTASVGPLTVGTWYSVTYTVSGFGAGTVNAQLGSGAFPTHAANGTYTETGLALTTAFAFTGVGFTGSIDNVSARSLTLSELFATLAPGTADYLLDINATMVSATDGKQVGIVSNLDSAATPANFRLTYLDGRGNVMVVDCIAGVNTVKATVAITYAAAATLRAILSGTALSRFYNGALVGTQQTMGANTSQLCGIFSTSPLSSLDVWLAMARGAGGEYSGLDAF